MVMQVIVVNAGNGGNNGNVGKGGNGGSLLYYNIIYVTVYVTTNQLSRKLILR